MASETTIISMREDFMMLVELLKCMGKFVCDWQPLIAGLLALLGAYLTVQQLRKQINLQKEQLDWEKQRAQNIPRFRLPFALAELCDYYNECIEVRKNENAIYPEISNDSIGVLIDAGANIDRKSFAVFKQVLTRLQVFESRLADNYDGLGSNIMLMDLVLLKHVTNLLFDYGHFESDKVDFKELKPFQLDKIASNWGISEELSDETKSKILRVSKTLCAEN